MRKTWTLGLVALASVLTFAACGDGGENTDPCANKECIQPDDYCDGNTAVTYSAAATCNPDTGFCENGENETRTDCGAQDQVCNAGACETPAECAEAADCTAIPGDTCNADGQLVTYAAACNAGTCEYTESATDCGTDETCTGGACVATTECTTAADCTNVPADECNADGQLVTYEASCSAAGACSYASSAADCTGGDVCESGACVTPVECTVATDCTDVPSDACNADSTGVVSYSASCNAGTCEYPSTDTACTGGDVCQAAACVTPTGCSTAADCTDVPADECNADGELVTYEASCNASNTCEYPPTATACDAGQVCDAGACRAMTTAEQIANVNANLGTQGLNQPVTDAVVTLITPDVSGDAGFFVQAAADGPALFVEGIPTLTNGTLQVGDSVDFDVVDVGPYPPAQVTIANFSVVDSGTDVSGWAQNIDNVDVVTNRTDYDAELVTYDATIVDGFGYSGSGYSEAQIETAGITGEPNLKFRAPNTVIEAADLANGCQIHVARAAVWAYTPKVQLTTFYADDVTATADCPAPQLVSANAISATQVELTFDRHIDAASVTDAATQFTFDGSLTASSATVDGLVVTVTTSAQTPATTYTVTVAASVTDTIGSGVDAAANTATFDGYQNASAPTGSFYFSEYIEGGSFNKAIEVYNGSADAVRLDGCSIVLYGNGSPTPTGTLDLTGVLASHDVLVACHPSIADTTNCDLTDNSAINWNGDDAVALECGSTTFDVIGQIGTDPGSEWISADSTVSTKDMTLQRMCSVTQGDSDGSDAFDPSVEWNALAKDTLDGLGSYTCP